MGVVSFTLPLRGDFDNGKVMGPEVGLGAVQGLSVGCWSSA